MAKLWQRGSGLLWISWWGLFAPTRLTDSGSKSECVEFIIDISDRQQAEAERKRLLAREQTARESAERANRIKDEFLAIVSHELRSPLNPILGWTTLLQTQKLNRDQTTKALNVISKNAKLQAELINDLLDVSQILRGKLSLNITTVDLAQTIRSALETVRLAAESKSIQIQTELESNVGLVSGDPNRLQQVFWNLFSNAVKFTPSEVLIVEDESDTREFLAFLLEREGARAIAVASAKEALATLTHSQPDVLLSDIGMSEMDGYMLLRQIRALPPERGGNIPAIALTAFAGEIDHQQAISAGFQQYLAKPIEPNKLVETIVSLVEYT